MIGIPEPPTSVYVDSIADSRLWKHFSPRVDDIVVVTPPKSGTTWVQAIVALLLSGDPGVKAEPSVNSPWIDAQGEKIEEIMARLAAQTNRRHVKTHTPLNGIPIWPELKYICVFRHPVDVFFSWRKHVKNLTFDFEDLPFIEDLSAGFRDYLDRSYTGSSGPTLQLVVNHYKCAQALGDRSNVLRMHYADMTRDLPGSMARIAEHIGARHAPKVMASLAEAATFDSMKANADRFAPAAGAGVWHKDEAFFDSASSNKWEGRLSEEDLSAYDRAISRELSHEERTWLEWGSDEESLN